MKNKILEKIKKLLSLATSSNEHEAQAASAKATELLTKYNLDMQAINFSDAEYEKNNIFSGSKKKMEHKFILGILNQYFNVKTIVSTGNRKSTITIVGDKTNVEVASYVFNFLEISFKQLFAQYRKETGAPVRSKQSYYFGLYKGFGIQMEEAKTKVEHEKGLIVVPDAGLSKYFRDEYPNTRRSNQSVITRDRDATAAGNEAGKNLKVSRGISSRNHSNIKYLSQG